jgi:hypothetical protein
MEDRFLKYSKLYLLIFLMFLCIPVFLGLLITAFWGISKLVSSSVADISFGLAVITLPPAILSAVYVIFFKRTSSHPFSAVRVISKILFLVGIASSILVLVFDMIYFFKRYDTNITGYHGLSLTYLAGNTAMLFLIAIIQAFTTKKEVGWMDRNR